MSDIGQTSEDTQQGSRPGYTADGMRRTEHIAIFDEGSTLPLGVLCVSWPTWPDAPRTLEARLTIRPNTGL
jgi:hypothetical protein